MDEYRGTELAFNTGGRPYNNKDFRVLQATISDTSSLLEGFSASFPSSNGNFIVNGCDSVGDSGLVWLGSYNIDESLNTKKLRFVEPYTGPTLVAPDIYIIEKNEIQNRIYRDGQSKNAFKVYKAEWSSSPGTGESIHIGSLSPTDFKLETLFTSILGFWSDAGGGNINYNGGNVGIGISNPQAQLEVLNNIYTRHTINTGFASIRILNDQNLTTRALELGYTGSAYATSPITGGVTGESAYISATGAYPIQFATSNNFRMIIDATGNVGIGLNNPTSKLHVSGNTTINGAIDATSLSTSGSITVGNTLTVSAGNLSVSSGTISASGNITSSATVNGNALSITTTGTFGTGLSVTSGNLTLNSGNITISGTGTGTDWIATSDIRLKTNIKNIDNALEKVKALQGRTFNRLDDADVEKIHYGFVAQEVEKIIPELVSLVNDTDIKAVNYDKFVAILVEAVKEQQKIIEDLNNRISILESK